MQNAKDTFYVTLQSRLAALNPKRTIIARGVIRPGTLVAENELPSDAILLNAFRLQWTGLQIDCEGPMPLVTMECSIQYATEGTESNGGMDRGRLLSAMDAEIASAFAIESHSIRKTNYATGTTPTVMGTNVFWSDPKFSAVTVADERLERSVTIQVYAYQEGDDL